MTSAEESKKLARFWPRIAVAFAIFIALPPAETGQFYGRAGMLAHLQQFFRWLLVEPLGLPATLAFVMACGCFAAWLSSPKRSGAS